MDRSKCQVLVSMTKVVFYQLYSVFSIEGDCFAGFKVYKECYKAGLNIKPTGDALIIAPPFICNKKNIDDYNPDKALRMIINQPLEVAKKLDSVDLRITVLGGGLSGQAGAIILGISRALISHDELLKKNLKKDKLTTRDSRVVERKKYGHRKARRSFQFSKR